MYPVEWDITPITISKATIGYDGISDTPTQTINVRLSFKRQYTKDANGDLVLGNGTFYKKGEQNINFGDNFQYDGIEYTVNNVYKARLETGVIEYTRVMF